MWYPQIFHVFFWCNHHIKVSMSFNTKDDVLFLDRSFFLSFFARFLLYCYMTCSDVYLKIFKISTVCILALVHHRKEYLLLIRCDIFWLLKVIMKAAENIFRAFAYRCLLWLGRFLQVLLTMPETQSTHEHLPQLIFLVHECLMP